MHEASLMKDLMHQIETIADTEGAERITEVQVWLGALSHMSRAHFQEHFETASQNTIAEGAELKLTLSQDTQHPQAQTIVLEGVEVETGES